MSSSLYQWNQGWSLLFLPWVLWSVIPPWHDVSLLTTFVISQVLLYSMQHMRGMLILSTLVLLLWTKSLLTRWYRTQTLTREFFKRLLYMGVTALVSLAAVFVVWMPLYEAYACVVSKLDRATANQAMDWRNTVFLIVGICLATSSIAQTDLVLRPNQVDNTGLAWVMRKLTHFLYRFIRYFLRDVLAMLRTAERCVHAGYKKRGKRAGSKQYWDMSDDDDDDEEEATEELRKQSDSSLLSASKSSRQTQSPVSIRMRSSSDARRVSSTDVPDNSYTSLVPNRHWLRSSHRSLMVEESASDIQQGPLRKPSCSLDKARRKMGVHSRYPSWDSEMLSMESTSDIQFVPRKKPTRPLNKAKIKAPFFSQHPSESPEPSVSYNMNERGSRSKSRLTEPVSNESSTFKLLQQSAIPKRKIRSADDTTSQLLQKSVIPGRETSAVVDTQTMTHLKQKPVIPRPETSTVVNTTSQLPQQSVSPTHDISSIVDTTSQILQNSVISTRETSAVVDTPTKAHLTPKSFALRRKTRSVLDTTSQLMQNSVIPGPETSPLDTTSMADLTQRSFTSICKTRSAADTPSELLLRSFTPVRETSSVIHTPIMVHFGQRNLTPSPVDTASLTSLPSINLRRKTSSNETNSSTDTCSFDSLKSDASSQTESVSSDSLTSKLLQQSVKPRLKNSSPVDTASLTSLPSVNHRRKSSSNETNSSTEICSFDSLKSGSSSQSGRSSPATTRFQSGSSVNFSISALLKRCALPSPPVTRSHGRLVQEKERAQSTIPRARKGRRPQTDDSLEKAQSVPHFKGAGSERYSHLGAELR